MTVRTTAGTRIYIAPPGDLPESPLESPNFWTEIGEVVNFGEFGRTYAEVTHESINNRNVRKFKGTRNDGNIPLQLGRDTSDDGQELLRQALDDDDDWNFKIELDDAPTAGTPTTLTFLAKVMSYTTNLGGPNQIIGATATLGIQSGSITEVAAAA